MIGPISSLANWASKLGNKLTRPLMEKVTGIDKDADLPKFHSKTFEKAIGEKSARSQYGRARSGPQSCDLRHLLCGL